MKFIFIIHIKLSLLSRSETLTFLCLVEINEYFLKCDKLNELTLSLIKFKFIWPCTFKMKQAKMFFILTFLALLALNNAQDELDFTQIVQRYNYSVEKHALETSDRYLIELYKMPANCTEEFKANCNKELQPQMVLLHGLYGSSTHWVIGGPKKVCATSSRF